MCVLKGSVYNAPSYKWCLMHLEDQWLQSDSVFVHHSVVMHHKYPSLSPFLLSTASAGGATAHPHRCTPTPAAALQPPPPPPPTVAQWNAMAVAQGWTPSCDLHRRQLALHRDGTSAVGESSSSEHVLHPSIFLRALRLATKAAAAAHPRSWPSTARRRVALPSGFCGSSSFCRLREWKKQRRTEQRVWRKKQKKLECIICA